MPGRGVSSDLPAVGLIASGWVDRRVPARVVLVEPEAISIASGYDVGVGLGVAVASEAAVHTDPVGCR